MRKLRCPNCDCIVELIDFRAEQDDLGDRICLECQAVMRIGPNWKKLIFIAITYGFLTFILRDSAIAKFLASVWGIILYIILAVYLSFEYKLRSPPPKDRASKS